MRRLVSAGISAGAALLFLAGAGAGAVESQAPMAPASPTPAPVNAIACQACHGVAGISSNSHIPNLAGQQSDYLVAQLVAFRSGDRKSDIMHSIASELSDAEMQDLAHYWNSRPATSMDPHGQASAGPAIPSRMTLPANFPAGFTLYQTVTAEGGVTERYANDVAIRAARAGQPLPNGSIILSVNRASAGGAITSYAGMESRAGWGTTIPALLRNGDWDYAVFNAAGERNTGLNQAQCLACHRPGAANSYVFTMAELRSAAARPAA
jgi:cytochrome c553